MLFGPFIAASFRQIPAEKETTIRDNKSILSACQASIIESRFRTLVA